MMTAFDLFRRSRQQPVQPFEVERERHLREVEAHVRELDVAIADSDEDLRQFHAAFFVFVDGTLRARRGIDLQKYKSMVNHRAALAVEHSAALFARAQLL